VTLRLGILAHVSADHLREHFLRASRGTAVEGARLAIEVVTDLADRQAQEILLDRVEDDRRLECAGSPSSSASAAICGSRAV
jgi:hydrogenase nickel incorporation protein HypA/HybF